MLVFALVATVIPVLTMSWFSYVMNREFVNEKTAEELKNATSHTAREFNLWLRERFYETRVFSSSYEVTENLEKILRGPSTDRRTQEARRRLLEYLLSVRSKFLDYDGLTVIGLNGGRLVGSDQTVSARLPVDWLKRIKTDANVVGEAYWDDQRGKPVVTIAVPIKAASGRLLGVMAGTLNFAGVERILRAFAVGRTGRMHFVDQKGVLIVSSPTLAAPGLTGRLPAQVKKGIAEEEGAALSYADARGQPVVANARRIPNLGWSVVAEIAYDEAHGRVSDIRNLTLGLLAALVLGIGLLAYLLALTIVRPLARLTAGAREVAAGGLKVDLPVSDYGEVGYLTRAFNQMVAHLREGREELGAVNIALGEMNRELKRLSSTDSLTGLFNHGHLIETLRIEVERARRLKHFFSVMMIDVDNFKHYNDSRGHPAGDTLLAEVGLLLRASVRSIDYAARYGGDEFLLLLHEVGPDGARRLADRIRATLGARKWNQGTNKITLSFGVACFPEDGESPEGVIASADTALYEAKRRGRNQTASAAMAGKIKGG